MPQLPRIIGPYSDDQTFTYRWRQLCADYQGLEQQTGRSVEGRPLWRFDFGAPSGPTILLTGLIHGIEFIGSVALFQVMRQLLDSEHELIERLHLVVLPVLNPDAFAENAERLARGRMAFRRSNARGVDLNRNFPWLASRLPRHPMAGSRFSWAPYYVGPHPFSEPETQAVRDVVRAVPPSLSLAFPSFGEQLL